MWKLVSAIEKKFLNKLAWTTLVMTIIINNDLTVVNQMLDVTIFSISFYDVSKFDIEG